MKRGVPSLSKHNNDVLDFMFYADSSQIEILKMLIVGKY